MENQTHEQSQPLNNLENGYELKMLAKCVPTGLNVSQIVVFIIYIITLVMGCYGLNKCPVDKKIPQFLISTAAIGLFSILIFTPFARRTFSVHSKVVYLEFILYIIQFALCILSILGIYWIVKQYKPNYDPASGQNYCNKTVYLYAFSYMVIGIIIPLIYAGFMCFLVCIFFVRATQAQNEDVEGQPTSRDLSSFEIFL